MEQIFQNMGHLGSINISRSKIEWDRIPLDPSISCDRVIRYQGLGRSLQTVGPTVGDILECSNPSYVWIIKNHTHSIHGTGIFTYCTSTVFCHLQQPNVNKYTIHGWYGTSIPFKQPIWKEPQKDPKRTSTTEK